MRCLIWFYRFCQSETNCTEFFISTLIIHCPKTCMTTIKLDNSLHRNKLFFLNIWNFYYWTASLIAQPHWLYIDVNCCENLSDAIIRLPFTRICGLVWKATLFVYFFRKALFFPFRREKGADLLFFAASFISEFSCSIIHVSYHFIVFAVFCAEFVLCCVQIVKSKFVEEEIYVLSMPPTTLDTNNL